MRILRVPGFGPLLAGQLVNAIGNWVAIIAIWGFAAFQFDAGAGDLALLFVVLSVPGAVLGPFLGIAIDRFGPRRTLIAANALGCLNALALTQADSYELVILLALPLGLIEALASASLDSLPPRLVDDDELVRANALLDGTESMAIILGPIVAAAVNLVWGLTGAFIADAATFVAGFAVAIRLDPEVTGPERTDPTHSRREVEPDVDHAATRSGTRPWAEFRHGLSLVRRTPGLRYALGVATSAYAIWAIFGVLEPLYVRDVLEADDTTFALLQTAFGVGLVGAGLALAWIGDRAATARTIAFATIFSGVTAALYVGTTSTAVAFAGVLGWGIGVAFFYSPAKTLLQRYAPLPAHGRILALNQALEPMTAIVITPAAAVIVGVVGVRALGITGGLLGIGAGLVALVVARSLQPPPPPGPVDPTAGTPRDAVALGGPAPI